MTLADKDLVRLCLKELFEKMGYSEGAKLTQSDLEHLAYLLEEKTRIIISLSTLKRIFQEKFERLPQTSTLDALTIFLGYSGWQDFKASKTAGNISVGNPGPKRVVSPKKNFSRFHYLYIAAGIVTVFFVVFMTNISGNKPEKTAFSVRKIVSDGVPNNVIFDYNIDDIKGDTFYIQPSWNPQIRVMISKNNYTQTDTYYEPGYHTAKLICDGRVLASVAVHIPTKSWVGYSKTSFHDPYPEYFKNEYLIRDGVLGITPDGLQASQVDTEKKKIYYYANFPDSIKMSSDNFTLRAKVRMSTLGNTLCPSIISEVISENSFFYFIGTIPGCTSEIKAMFSDRYLDGKTNDLSALGYDVMNWNEIMINVRKRNVTIFIEGKKVLENTYARPGGPVQGMGFGSNGLCEIDFVELSDSTGRVAYFNDFNGK